MVAPSKERPRLIVRGAKGFLDGEERVLDVGEILIVGRSRGVDLSTRASNRLARRADRLDVIRSDAFKSVSRKHAVIRFLHPGLVEVKDLSANGTFLDGRRIDCVAITDLDQRSHVLDLGSQERIVLQIVGAGADRD